VASRIEDHFVEVHPDCYKSENFKPIFPLIGTYIIFHPFCSDPVKFYNDPGWYPPVINNMKHTCKRMLRAYNPQRKFRGLANPKMLKVENNIAIGSLERPGSGNLRIAQENDKAEQNDAQVIMEP